jgi:hypothetical protein
MTPIVTAGSQRNLNDEIDRIAAESAEATD